MCTIIGVGYFSPVERSLVGSNSSKKVVQREGGGLWHGMQTEIEDHGLQI